MFRLKLLGKKPALLGLVLKRMRLGVIGHRRHPRLSDRDVVIRNDRHQPFEMIGVIVGADNQMEAQIVTPKVGHRLLERT
jgi:hypothetical protein